MLAFSFFGPSREVTVKWVIELQQYIGSYSVIYFFRKTIVIVNILQYVTVKCAEMSVNEGVELALCDSHREMEVGL